ncbi:hypothetical protein HMPREF9078_02404 [Capnocytophaga sp. oral taxon 380 str. F0488]|nr:hypothetical protein HMPREF9078_02404 [Capnocytophaga sp. oral taxon 380 str. F0488]
MKAIHNTNKYSKHQAIVVINRKTTKFESNSQHRSAVPNFCNCCYQSQNYKI